MMGVAGAIIGYIIYKKNIVIVPNNYNRNIKFESLEFPGTRDSFIFFSQCAFSVMGNICKSKGRVTENDIKIAVDFMDQLNLKGEIRKISQEAFNSGKQKSFNVNNVLLEFYREFSNNSQIIDLFLEIQIKICFSDGFLESKERDILMNIANKLNISDNYIINKISLYKNMYNFEHSSYTYNQSYQDNSFSKKGYSSKNSVSSVLKDAYSVLGVSDKDGKDEVKKAYRKLMNQYHPDKLSAKKIPKEYYEIYNEKSQQIINSYKIICEHNGWK